RVEVLTSPAAKKSGTTIMELLVPLCFRSSCQSLPRCITNFGKGALAGRSQCLCDVGAEAGNDKQTAQCDSECRPEAQDGEVPRKRGVGRLRTSEGIGDHGPAPFLIVTFDSMKRSGRRLFHATLTT